MSDNIVKFYPADAAKNPDYVLEQAIGQYKEVVIIGLDHDDMVDARASTNFKISDILLCMEQFKHNVLSGSYDVAIVDGEE